MTSQGPPEGTQAGTEVQVPANAFGGIVQSPEPHCAFVVQLSPTAPRQIFCAEQIEDTQSLFVTQAPPSALKPQRLLVHAPEMQLVGTTQVSPVMPRQKPSLLQTSEQQSEFARQAAACGEQHAAASPSLSRMTHPALAAHPAKAAHPSAV